MKNFLVVLLLALFTTSPLAKKNGVVYDVIVTRVIDGDTIAFEANWLPDPLKKELSIRVFGVDTPEKGSRASCDNERKKAQKASDLTTTLIWNSKKVQIELMDWDKYGGRVLGDVIIDGKSLRAELIKQKLAREYYGEKKTSWC